MSDEWIQCEAKLVWRERTTERGVEVDGLSMFHHERWRTRDNEVVASGPSDLLAVLQLAINLLTPDRPSAKEQP